MADSKNTLYTNIFDFIDADLDETLTNIKNGNIAFLDKSFDEYPIPKMFSPLNNNFTYLKDLKYYNLENIKNIVKKNKQDKFVKYLNIIMYGLDNLKSSIEKIILGISDIHVLLMRATGNKLNDIGVSRNLTRERIRQIENNQIEEVSLYITTYLDIMYKVGTYNNIMFYDFNDIFSFIKNEDVLKIINYAINCEKVYSFATYVEDFSCYCNPLKIEKISDIKNSIVLQKYFNYFDNYSKLNNSIIFKHNILDFRISIYLNYLKNNNYLFKGNLAYIFGECSVNDIISMVIRDYYPDGIILDENGINDLTDFIEKLLNYSFKINSALAKIDELNDELILWGKLKRIHIANVNIEKSKLEMLISEFKKIVDNVDYLLFEDAYNALYDVLVGTPITDKYKLYGIIKYYLNEDFYFKKMAVRKLELKNQTLSDIVYDFINKHDMCTKDDIVANLFIPKSSLFAVYRDKRDIICTNNYHTLINKLNISDETIKILKNILLNEINNNYCHRDILFEKYKEILVSHNIEDSTKLFHITRYYFDDNYIFNSPYIQSKEYDKPVNMRNIILDIFERSNYITSINDINSEAGVKTATKDFSLVYYLRITDINVFRMNKEMLTLAEKVHFDDIVKYMINNRLNDHFNKNEYAITKDLKELSKGLYYSVGKKKYPMDVYSLCSFIEGNYSEYYVLSSSAINNYIDANYAISKKYTSYIDLVYQILKDNSKNNIINKQEAIRLLKRKELLSSIPAVLFNERYLRVENDDIYLLK